MSAHPRATTAIALAIGALLVVAPAARAQTDAEAPADSFDLGSILNRADRGGLTITSGKTYNRVEGLPILFGPTYRNRLGHADVSIAALGIIRTAHNFHWDPENLGHKLSLDVRYGRHRGFGLGAESFDRVEKIEPWQLTEPDGGLAAFLLRRDYFDWFGRHGGRVYASAFTSDAGVLTVGYSSERWSSRRTRDVFTLFRDDDEWRDNPRVNDGLVHVADVRFNFDTRNEEFRPFAGWYIDATYEYGVGNFQTAGTRLATDIPGERHLEYSRAFLDLRRYNRISPRRQLNARLVVAGKLGGDPLPLERKFSVGGIGTVPGFAFRQMGLGTDVQQCSPDTGPLPGKPAECDRVALAQLEYRHELVSELIDIFNRNRIHVRGAQFRVKPTAVAFVDAGRGWLVGKRAGDLTYPSSSFPVFDTFRTDVGIGLDLGIAGLYVAKAVSESKEPANFFVRIRSRL
jgi:hypothetical protein